MNREQFVTSFADIYEHSAWIAQTSFEQGISIEHNDVHALHNRMQNVLSQATDQQKLALINAHPDLAGKAAVAGELTES
jgi:OHCU decarboxylase